MLELSTQAKAHRPKERKDDLYETPAVATRALLRAERLPHRIWEPACGRGAIASVLRSNDHSVHATDLVGYGYGCGGIDFLMEIEAPAGIECVVTNPPFKLATEFVSHGLQLCTKVIVLCRLAFLEGAKRSRIMDYGQLARVYPFVNRLPMMHRGGWDGPKSSSAVAFAWFVFDRNHNGPTELRRIYAEKEREVT